MRALIVYESMFGNTEQIAQAVAEGLTAHMRADAVEVGEAPKTLDDDIDLLVVGGPTHAFGMSRSTTREEAAKQAPGGLVSRGIGIREWLAELPQTRQMPAATFDTRVKVRVLPGSAARGAAKRLRRLGYRLVWPPESFYVDGTPGPLRHRELERAREWGEVLGNGMRSLSARSHG